MVKLSLLDCPQCGATLPAEAVTDGLREGVMVCQFCDAAIALEKEKEPPASAPRSEPVVRARVQGAAGWTDGAHPSHERFRPKAEPPKKKPEAPGPLHDPRTVGQKVTAAFMGLLVAAVLALASYAIGLQLSPEWSPVDRLARALIALLIMWPLAGYVLVQTVSGWVPPDDYDDEVRPGTRRNHHWKPATAGQRYLLPFVVILAVGGGILLASIFET